MTIKHRPAAGMDGLVTAVLDDPEGEPSTPNDMILYSMYLSAVFIETWNDNETG